MKSITIRLLPVIALFFLAACATTPKGPPPEVERLNNQLTQLRSDQRVAANAPDELDKAQSAVNALAGQARTLDEQHYQQRVYVADRLVQTAEAIGMARYQEQRGKQLGRERDQLLLQVQTRQAEQARQAATVAQASAETERRNAEMAREEAAAARAQLEDMRSKLSDLKTKQTKRGLVITLGDVLFEVDKASLKPGATRSLDQLAEALKDDPGAQIQIEGHTDSTGSRTHNMELSRDRASAVQSYLTANGISASRITTRGLGPDYPVATNKTAAGRQQNRRVEVIVRNRDNNGQEPGRQQ
ncbi:MAG: OmpA family protein [Rhodanobacteraceae bacterium]